MEIIYGLHAIAAVLKSDPLCIKELHIHKGRQDQRMNEIIELAQENGITCHYHDKAYFEKHYADSHTQGLVASVSAKRQLQEEDIWTLLEKSKGPHFILILDGITDPHNLGACLRSADAAGVTLVIAPRDRAVGLTGAVSKVASGAAESVAFVAVTNLARVMEKLKKEGVWLYGLVEDASTSLYDTDFTGNVALCLGAEGTGLRRLTRDSCDGLVNIPMQGVVPSLNVSVATGICLYEVVRQRRALV